ncbi:oligosaccharide flippase family protein [Parapedobacter sp. ISTM3]|uniref:lipopolysaccharide biosynthesis protein n=1 Tax=Parapedobacter sp. ISTM3 TaxID=2800130 RepID=UPI00190608DE|nr:oligosaccharide flippase family protein [Parapedobacter sp. ISTM3]MBK1440625.1 oligosaccharide flippase family protein [Parapedobacter sp. ISTM3]
MSVLQKFAGQTAIYGLSTIVARLINFVLTPLFVRKFPTAVYGIFTHLYSWAAMVQAVLAFGMETTFFRYLQKHENNKERVLSNSFLVILFVSVLFVITVFLFTPTIAAWLDNGGQGDDYPRYVRYFAVILAADALAVIPFAQLRADGRPIRFAVVKLLNVLTLVGLNLLFIVVIPWALHHMPAWVPYFEGWYRQGWLGYVFLANLAASGLTLVLLLPELRKIRLRPDRKLLVDMLSYSFPVLVANISFIINEYLDKMMIPLLVPGKAGEVDNGIYGAVSRIAVFLSLFVQAFRLGAEPFFFSYAKNANARSVYAIIMDYFVIAMVLVMVGITVNIEWLKYFIRGGSEADMALYWSGLHIVPILLMGYVLLGIYVNLSIWYKLSDQTRFGLYISGIGAVITLVLNFVFIPRYSYVASVWITLVVYCCMVALSYFWGQQRYPIPYRVGKALGYILAGAGICWLSFSVFDRNVYVGNLLFLGFIGVTLLLERKMLLAVFKRSAR